MVSKNIKENILQHSLIANQTNPKVKNRFAKTAFMFIKKAKINQNYSNEKLNQLKINLAVAFAHISLHFDNKLLVFIPEFFLSSDEKFRNQDYYIFEKFKFEEGIVLHESTNQDEIYSILCSTILRAYLHINISTPYFSDNLLQLETEIAKSFSGVSRDCKVENSELEQNPIYRFAEISKQYFTKPSNLEIKSPSLFSKLEKFWKPDLTKYKNGKATNNFSKNEMHNQGLSSSGKLHFIYKFTIVSVFVSSFFTLLIATNTLISIWQILLMILLPALTPYLFKNIFRNKNIPIMEIPFALFSIFGFGMNVCLLILSLNYFILKESSEKNYFFKSKSKEIIDTRNYYNKSNNILEFEAVLLFPNGTKKTLTFESKKNTDHNFYIITQKGLFGKEVIVKKQTF